MSHMVIFRTPEGKPGYQPAETIEEAVEVVERLRNDDGVDNVRIFRLDEVIFEYKPYYKVEIAGSASSPTGSDASSPATTSDAGGFDSGDGDTSFDRMAADTDSIETSSSDSDSSDSPSAWDAPPPPPPAGVFGEHNSTDVDASELSESGTARRGLFGR